jgi:hypothetical protein
MGTLAAAPQAAEPTVKMATPSRKPVVLVSQPARENEQGRVDDRVAVQHPGQRAETGLTQVYRDLRQRDVHDEQVQAGHDHAGADDDQDLSGAQRGGPGCVLALT